MKAELLFEQRIDYDDGAIVEMVIWRVPEPVPPSRHDLKYRLFTVERAHAMWATTMNAAKAIIATFKASRAFTSSKASRS